MFFFSFFKLTTDIVAGVSMLLLTVSGVAYAVVVNYGNKDTDNVFNIPPQHTLSYAVLERINNVPSVKPSKGQKAIKCKVIGSSLPYTDCEIAKIETTKSKNWINNTELKELKGSSVIAEDFFENVPKLYKLKVKGEIISAFKKDRQSLLKIINAENINETLQTLNISGGYFKNYNSLTWLGQTEYFVGTNIGKEDQASEFESKDKYQMCNTPLDTWTFRECSIYGFDKKQVLSSTIKRFDELNLNKDFINNTKIFKDSNILFKYKTPVQFNFHSSLPTVVVDVNVFEDKESSEANDGSKKQLNFDKMSPVFYFPSVDDGIAIIG